MLIEIHHSGAILNVHSEKFSLGVPDEKLAVPEVEANLSQLIPLILPPMVQISMLVLQSA